MSCWEARPQREPILAPARPPQKSDPHWQRHPSLSYAVLRRSSVPTSQAPRLDEARDDQLTSSRSRSRWCRRPAMASRRARGWSIGFSAISSSTSPATRIVPRFASTNVLARRSDRTAGSGLSSAHSKMPPHPRMSLAQQLLLRALVAFFWREPQRGSPVRWGVLPCMIDSCSGIRLAGFSWRAGSACAPPDMTSIRSGSNAQREFRFPFYGAVTHGGVTLELRGALEPWHVLGEDATAGATTRSVDSSIERLQVRIEGLNPARHAIACNGRRVPLSPTGRSGEYVAVGGGSRRGNYRRRCTRRSTSMPRSPSTFSIVGAAFARRLCLSCGHPGGRQLRNFADQLLRSGGAALGAIPGSRAYPQDLSICRKSKRALRISDDS